MTYYCRSNSTGSIFPMSAPCPAGYTQVSQADYMGGTTPAPAPAPAPAPVPVPLIPQIAPIVYTDPSAPGWPTEPLPREPLSPMGAMPMVAAPVATGIMAAISRLQASAWAGQLTKVKILAFVKKYKISLAMALGMVGMSAMDYVNLEEGKRRRRMGLINARAWKTIKKAYTYRKQLIAATKMLQKAAPPSARRAKKGPGIIVETGPGGVRA